MNNDLQDCITTAKKARDALLEGKMSVKEANGVTAANHTIISAYAYDLRERMFLAEEEGRNTIERITVNSRVQHSIQPS